MAKKLIFEKVNFSIEEELEIILIKRFHVETPSKDIMPIRMSGRQKQVKFSRLI